MGKLEFTRLWLLCSKSLHTRKRCSAAWKQLRNVVSLLNITDKQIAFVYFFLSNFFRITELWYNCFYINTFKYHVSYTNGKISVRINLLFYLFFTNFGWDDGENRKNNKLILFLYVSNAFKYHVSCTDGKISVKNNLLFYLFFTNFGWNEGEK